MIDLIIPYYNNRIGLLNTLKSINTNVFQITIVDDHSTETPIIDNSVAQVLRLNVNSGPGYARQRGIEHTNNPYIMFMDTGDIFVDNFKQSLINELIDYYKNINIFTCQYNHYGQPANLITDNRLHGKIYKREFLEKYGITFCPDSSYLNEDVGFNRTCRIISEAINIPFHLLFTAPIINQIKDDNSLTQKNNQIALYRDQTRALSLVSIHTINILEKNNISIQEEINQIAVSLYYWFIRTMAERPEFAQEAWSGARIFYTQLEQKIQPNNLILGNAKIKQCLLYKDKVNFPINILRFSHDIQMYETIPTNYKR